VQIAVVAVGRPNRLLEPAIREYEQRAGRYWKLEIRAVKGETASRNRPIAEIQRAEGERLRSAAPAGHELIALTRGGQAWSSERLAGYLDELAIRGTGGAAFLIGGAAGLSHEIIAEARHRLSLSELTMPHDLARLLLAEQLYRAGTIVRGEPYHKG
jgi:23S rRNA (pseudouridine1915-N3)-methyltransferase